MEGITRQIQLGSRRGNPELHSFNTKEELYASGLTDVVSPQRHRVLQNSHSRIPDQSLEGLEQHLQANSPPPACLPGTDRGDVGVVVVVVVRDSFLL